jgi:GMP synthase (glutamine-hydrolysing)
MINTFHYTCATYSQGKQVLHNFCVGVCSAPTDWNMRDIATDFINEVRERVGPTAHVIGAVSGGVDSSVAAVLLKQAIGDRFHAVMVDNGGLRKNESVRVVERLKEKLGINLTVLDASNQVCCVCICVSECADVCMCIYACEYICVFDWLIEVVCLYSF